MGGSTETDFFRPDVFLETGEGEAPISSLSLPSREKRAPWESPPMLPLPFRSLSLRLPNLFSFSRSRTLSVSLGLSFSLADSSLDPELLRSLLLFPVPPLSVDWGGLEVKRGKSGEVEELPPTPTPEENDSPAAAPFPRPPACLLLLPAWYESAGPSLVRPMEPGEKLKVAGVKALAAKGLAATPGREFEWVVEPVAPVDKCGAKGESSGVTLPPCSPDRLLRVLME